MNTFHLRADGRLQLHAFSISIRSIFQFGTRSQGKWSQLHMYVHRKIKQVMKTPDRMVPSQCLEPLLVCTEISSPADNGKIPCLPCCSSIYRTHVTRVGSFGALSINRQMWVTSSPPARAETGMSDERKISASMKPLHIVRVRKRRWW